MNAIDLEHDELKLVQELCRERLGKRVDPSTLWRWVRKGARGVKLEAVHVCGKWYSTPGAFARFIEGQTAQMLPALPEDVPDERPEAKARRLRQLGVLP